VASGGTHWALTPLASLKIPSPAFLCIPFGSSGYWLELVTGYKLEETHTIV